MDNVIQIQLTVERMKASVTHVLIEHTKEISAEMQRQVDEALSVENIRAVIKDTLVREVNNALKNEVESFFRYGEGRASIKKGVQQALKERLEAGDFDLPGD